MEKRQIEFKVCVTGWRCISRSSHGANLLPGAYDVAFLHRGRIQVRNLDKTRRLLSQATHDLCKRNNFSSCRSDIAPATPVTPTLPSGPGYQ